MRYSFDDMLTLDDVAEKSDEYIRNKTIGFNSIIVKFSPLHLVEDQYERIKIPRIMIFNKTTGLYDIIILTSTIKPETQLDMLANRAIETGHQFAFPSQIDAGILKSIYEGE